MTSARLFACRRLLTVFQHEAMLFLALFEHTFCHKLARMLADKLRAPIVARFRHICRPLLVSKTR